MRIHKTHGVLMCGGPNFKVYLKANDLLIVNGAKVFTVPKDLESLVMRYVNLKYQNEADKPRIKADFDAVLNSLKVS